MTQQRHIRQFHPLVKSGYAESSRHIKAPPDNPAWPGYVTIVYDHHVTLRIDVAKLANHLVHKITSGRGTQSVMAGGAIRMKINTTKARE